MKKVIWTLVLLLGACSWRSPNSEFYMMNSRGLTPISEKTMNIAVAKVIVPDLLDRSQMVVYDGKNGQVEILEFNRWGEVLPDVLQATVVNDLIMYLPKAYVQRTYFDSSSAPYNINIEINSLQAYKGEKVILSAWWQINNAQGKTLIRRQGLYEAPVDGRSIEALVNGQTTAVHQMSKDIAEQLLKL